MAVGGGGGRFICVRECTANPNESAKAHGLCQAEVCPADMLLLSCVRVWLSTLLVLLFLRCSNS